jgi:hypothetical protein
VHSGNRTLTFPHDRIITFSDKELNTWIEKIKSMIGRTDNERKARSLEIELCYLQREMDSRVKLHRSEPRIARPRLHRRV